MWFKLFLVACLVVAANTGPASFIQKCQTEDSKCHKESSQAALSVFTDGIPELGIEQLDPLHYKTLDASSKNLQLMLSDIEIGGIKQCQIRKVVRDSSKIFLKALCDITVNGNYIINGTILILPIRGKGRLSAVLRKTQINVEAHLTDQVLEDEKKHWNIKTWKYSYDLKENADLDLENLFEGNEVLSMAVRQLLKTNANDVIREVGDPIIKGLLTKIIKVLNKFLKNVPVEELSLD